MTTILDTSFIFALREKKDKNHQRSLEIFNSLEGLDKKELITNIFIVSETYTLMNARTHNNKAAIQDLDSLFWGEDNFFKIHHFSQEENIQISYILNKYSTSKKILSFVDASIIYLCNLLGYQSVISFDKHFDGILKRIH